MDQSSAIPYKFNKKEVCFIILGHEIDQKSFKLSFSGKKRCEILAKELKILGNKEYFVIFMGLGRLQGKCKLSISECMFQYFSEKYFVPNNFFLEKQSVDTIGDAIFSYKLINSLNFKNDIFVITSDWHLKRVKHIFKKIYNFKENLFFLNTSEIYSLSPLEIHKLKQNENKSIKLFEKFFDEFKKSKSDIFIYLKENHDCYKSLNL